MIKKKEKKVEEKTKKGRPKKLHQQLNTQFTPSEKEIEKIDFDIINDQKPLQEEIKPKEEIDNKEEVDLEIKLSEEMDMTIGDIKTEKQTQRIIEDNIPKKIIAYYTLKNSDEQYKGKVFYQGKFYDSLQIFISQFQLNNKKLPKSCYPVQEINLEINTQNVLDYLFGDNVKFIEQHKLKILTVAFNKFNQCNGVYNNIHRENYLTIKFKEQN